MAKRFSGTYFDLEGTEYTVEIHDAQFTGTSDTFIIERAPVIKWKGNNSDKYEPVIPSTCSFSFMVQGAALRLFEEDMIYGEDKRFTVQIYRATDLYWFGYVLSRIASAEYASEPYAVSLECVDGIARLVEQTVGTTGPLGTLNQIEEFMLFFCEQIGFLDLFGPTDPVLSTYTNQSYDDVLVFPTVPDFFQNVNISNDTYTDENSFEVLQEICRYTNSRFFYSDGRYWMLPMNYEKDAFDFQNVYPVFSYDKSNTLPPPSSFQSRLVRIATAGVSILSNTRMNYLTGLSKVTWDGITEYDATSENLATSAFTETKAISKTIAQWINRAAVVTNTGLDVDPDKVRYEGHTLRDTKFGSYATREIQLGRNTPKRQLRTTLDQVFDMLQQIELDGVVYTPTGLTVSTQMNQTSGTYVEVFQRRYPLVRPQSKTSNILVSGEGTDSVSIASTTANPGWTEGLWFARLVCNGVFKVTFSVANNVNSGNKAGIGLLSSEPTDYVVPDSQVGIEINISNVVCIYAGSTVHTQAIGSATDTYSISYNGERFKYYVNGTVIHNEPLVDAAQYYVMVGVIANASAINTISVEDVVFWADNLG